MGGKGGSVATNNQMVQMQAQQSAQAELANAERNARLTTGAQQITGMFEGRPAGSHQVNLADPNSGYSFRYAGDDGSGVPQIGLYDSAGQLVTSAATLDQLQQQAPYVGGDPNNLQGGFGQPFYDKFTNSILGSYMPQEQQQYSDANTSLAYNLARSGSLNSTIANTDRTKLQLQDKINQAQIASQAETQTGALRNTVQQDEQTALNQLYSTEDPSVAANTAGNMVANANLQTPVINPLGALFTPITAGIGNAITGFTNPYAYINPGAQAGIAATPGAGGGGAGTPVQGY